MGSQRVRYNWVTNTFTFFFLPSSRLTGKRTALMLGQPSKLTSSHRWLCVHDKTVISVRGYLAAKRQVKTILTLWRLLYSSGWWLHDKSGRRVSEAPPLNPVSSSHSANGKTAAFTGANSAISKTQTTKPRPHWPSFVPLLGLFLLLAVTLVLVRTLCPHRYGPNEHFPLQVSLYCVDN